MVLVHHVAMGSRPLLSLGSLPAYSLLSDTPSFTVEVPVSSPSSPLPARAWLTRLQPINLIHAEILAVVSAMRKNQRWASSSTSNFSPYPFPATSSSSTPLQSAASSIALRNRDSTPTKGGREPTGAQNNTSLLSGFMTLKMELRNVEGARQIISPRPLRAETATTGQGASWRRRGDGGVIAVSMRRNHSVHDRRPRVPRTLADTRRPADMADIDALVLLNPFLEVVRSPETSGPITATSLSSIDKFLTYSILHPGSPNLAPAMAQLSTAGTHCKFEASDSVSDEVVLLKILDVLRNCLTGRLGDVLSDESVCEMMETGLSMCCQMRLSGMCPFPARRRL